MGLRIGLQVFFQMHVFHIRWHSKQRWTSILWKVIIFVIESWKHSHFFCFFLADTGSYSELKLYLLYHYHVHFAQCSLKRPYATEDKQFHSSPFNLLILRWEGSKYFCIATICEGCMAWSITASVCPTCRYGFVELGIAFTWMEVFQFSTLLCSFPVAKDSFRLQQFGGNYIKKLLFIIKTCCYNSSIYCNNLQGY